MADFVFNIGKGRVAEMAANTDDLRVMLLKTGDTEANLQDADNITAILAGTPVEADFTGYSPSPREILTNVVLIVDDTANEGQADCDNIVWSPAGGATNNNVVAAVIYKHVTNDGDAIPLTYHDAIFTTNGSDVTLQIPVDGFFGAA